MSARSSRIGRFARAQLRYASSSRGRLPRGLRRVVQCPCRAVPRQATSSTPSSDPLNRCPSLPRAQLRYTRAQCRCEPRSRRVRDIAMAPPPRSAWQQAGQATTEKTSHNKHATVYCNRAWHSTVSPVCAHTGVALGQYICSSVGHSMYGSGQPGCFATGSQKSPRGLPAQCDVAFGLHSTWAPEIDGTLELTASVERYPHSKGSEHPACPFSCKHLMNAHATRGFNVFLFFFGARVRKRTI